MCNKIQVREFRSLDDWEYTCTLADSEHPVIEIAEAAEEWAVQKFWVGDNKPAEGDSVKAEVYIEGKGNYWVTVQATWELSGIAKKVEEA